MNNPLAHTNRKNATAETRQFDPIWHWGMSACILYLELAFKASTTKGFFPQVIPIALFSLCIGQLLHVLCSLSPSPRVNRAMKVIVLAVLGVLFSVEYFVFRQFKLFYDPITVISGAGVVAGQFGGTALGLVLSPQGLAHVLLFMAPAICYAIFGCWRGLDPARQLDATDRILQCCNALGSYLLALFLVACLGPLGDLYTTRYSFQNGVQSFGLLTSLRKEVQQSATGTSQSFQPTPEPTEEAIQDSASSKAPEPAESGASSAPKTKSPAPEPPEYVTSTLDIDFGALADTTEGTWADIDRYVASLTPSSHNEYTGIFKGYNLVFISAEAFCSEAIRPDTTPTLYKMWKHGIQLTDFYQFDTAGTTGGECANLFGLLATEGGSSVKMTADHNNYLTMGNLLNRQGYNGWAFHNNTYTYYGRDATHINLGYNNGYMGYGNGMEQWVAWQWPQSDLEMVQGTFDNLYGQAAPYNVYYMSVSGHSDYGPGENQMAVKNWDVVADLPYSDRVKGYLGANVELDRAMEYLLARLKETGQYRKTVIVICADHFPYGLDDDAPLGQMPYLSELYGYDVQDIFQRDHNRPIIWCGALAKRSQPIVVDSPTMSIDLLPTLCNLFGVEWDSRLLPGRDVLDPATEGIAFNLDYDWRTSLGTYWAGSGTFQPNEGVEVPDGYVEQHNAMVANKINYCHAVLTTDYYRHVFGDPQDVATVHDEAANAG